MNDRMPETPSLAAILGSLRRLAVSQESPAGSDALTPLAARMLADLPQLTRGCVECELERRKTAGASRDDIADFVRAVFLEKWRDPILSTKTQPITNYRALFPLLRMTVEQAVHERSTERIEKVGCLFFDIDGFKAIVESIAHQRASEYLRRVSRILEGTTPETAAFLDEHRIELQSFSFSGDEFVVLATSENGPLDDALLGELSARLHADVAGSAELREFIDFDDPLFLIRYHQLGDSSALATEESAEMTRMLRSALPDRFVPSVSGGHATLQEGIVAGADWEETLPTSIDAAAKVIVTAMIELADQRGGEYKLERRRALRGDDPKLYEFYQRTGEARKMARELHEAQATIEALQGAMRDKAVHIFYTADSPYTLGHFPRQKGTPLALRYAQASAAATQLEALHEQYMASLDAYNQANESGEPMTEPIEVLSDTIVALLAAYRELHVPEEELPAGLTPLPDPALWEGVAGGS